jgi:hypothetical protein
MGANQENFQRVQDKCGLNEEHILMITAMDQEKLVIHEQFKQTYMKICKSFFIQNDFHSLKIHQKNRCYMWEKCGNMDNEALEKNAEYFYPPKPKEKKKIREGRSDDTVFYDFY